MSNPLISVVVSTYCGARYIRRCLELLEAQTVAHRLEILVIDSGSPENERSIVEELQQAHENIVYVRTDRETLYAAWNRALELATGTYFANFNVDDWIREDALELMALALERHSDADIAYAHWAATTVAQQPPTGDDPVSFHSRYEPALPLFYCYGGSTQFWRRSSLVRLGGFDSSFTACGDLEVLCRLTLAGGVAVLVPQVLEGFFQNPDGISRATDVSLQEQSEVFARARRETPLDRLYSIDPGDAASVAGAWTVLGNMAMQVKVPWHEGPLHDAEFAMSCYERALDAMPKYRSAMHNRYVVQFGDVRWGDAEASLDQLTPREAAAVRGADLDLWGPSIEPAVRGPVLEVEGGADPRPLHVRSAR